MIKKAEKTAHDRQRHGQHYYKVRCKGSEETKYCDSRGTRWWYRINAFWSFYAWCQEPSDLARRCGLRITTLFAIFITPHAPIWQRMKTTQRWWQLPRKSYNWHRKSTANPQLSCLSIETHKTTHEITGKTPRSVICLLSRAHYKALLSSLFWRLHL